MSEADDFQARMDARRKRKDEAARAKAKRRERDMLVLDDLEIEHGDDNVKPIYTTPGMVVVRRPTGSEAQQFQEEILKDAKTPARKAQAIRMATEKLARRCRLHPESDVYDEWVEGYGGIPANVGNVCAQLADIVIEDEAEK